MMKKLAKNQFGSDCDVILVVEEFLEKHFVVVVALLFYIHGKHLRPCRDGQLT